MNRNFWHGEDKYCHVLSLNNVWHISLGVAQIKRLGNSGNDLECEQSCFLLSYANSLSRATDLRRRKRLFAVYISLYLFMGSLGAKLNYLLHAAKETGKFSGVMNTFVPRGFVFQRHMFDTHLANQYLCHMVTCSYVARSYSRPKHKNMTQSICLLFEY